MIISEEAQKKLQELRESGDFCCISLNSDFDYVWDISIVWFEMSNHKPDSLGLHQELKICDHSHKKLDEAVEHLYNYWKIVRGGYAKQIGGPLDNLWSDQ